MPRNAALSLAVALAVTTSACAHASPAQRVGMVTAGGGLLVTASAIASVQEDDYDSDSDAGSWNMCPDNTCLLTFGVVAAVGALVLTGVMSGTDHGKEAPPAPITPVFKDGPPGGDASVAIAPLPREHRPLPEIATDERTVQLAKQVRSAALRGDCDAVSITLATIHERDPRYHDALLASSVIVGCR